MQTNKELDFDYIVIGSGFGGSISAMRLVERGYRVCVIEQGRRFASEDFPKSNWDLKRYLWFPLLKCFGIQQLTPLGDVLVLSGAGVGGGSLVYANTLAMPGDVFFQSKEWSYLADWKQELAPHYNTVKYMLGGVQNTVLSETDFALQEFADSIGRGHTFKPATVAVNFGKQLNLENSSEEKISSQEPSDPYFGGLGPVRSSCVKCGGCMVGCRFNAKNTLDKNYLYFAEKGGMEGNCVPAQVLPFTKVTNIVPLNDNGTENFGFEVHTVTTGKFFTGKFKKVTAKNVIVSAGVMGTQKLLLRCKYTLNSLPRISKQLGTSVRTNGEVFTGISHLPNQKEPRIVKDYSKGIAIGSLIHADENTSIETVRYPAGSNFMRLISGPMVEHPVAWKRAMKFLKYVIQNPIVTARMFLNPDWAKNSIIFLVMQSVDNKISLKYSRSWRSLFLPALQSIKVPGATPLPTEIPLGNLAAKFFAKKFNARTQVALTQVGVNVSTTAHILGGCPIGGNAELGVINQKHEVFGYKGLYVCDGSVIPANIGVNPSFTISALAERMMTFIPKKGEL